MAGFFIFIASMFSDLVGLYFDLPFLDGVSLGDILVAIAILGVVASALVGQLSSFNLRHEASEAIGSNLKINGGLVKRMIMDDRGVVYGCACYSLPLAV